VLIWFHIQAFAAFWSFSWTEPVRAVFLYWVAIGLGISMGYHRLHTHRGFKKLSAVRVLSRGCGTLTQEGGPIFWVADASQASSAFRQELDPHTPRVNGFWAHLGLGLCSVRRTTTTPADVEVRARPGKKTRSTRGSRPITGCADGARFSLLAIGGWAS